MRTGVSLYFFAVFLGLCSTVYGGTDGFIQTIQEMKRSVVPVVCLEENPDGSAKLVSVEGSAFFVSREGAFLTAGHVIKALEPGQPRKTPCPTPAIYLPIRGWQPAAVTLNLRGFKFGGCTVDEALDLGLCRTLDDISSKASLGVEAVPVSLENSMQPDGTPVAFTGFPLSMTQPITSRGAVGTYRIVKDQLGPREILIDKNAWPGVSGSPIYLENGKVVGIIIEAGVGVGLE